MAIHYVADHNVEQGVELVWQLESGVLYEDISPMLKSIFKEHLSLLNFAPEDRFVAEVHVANKIKFHDKISADYLLIYFPVIETTPRDVYQDDDGSYQHKSKNIVNLEVPLYEIRELIREQYPHIDNVDSVVDKILKAQRDNTHFHDNYYGNTVTYQYIKLKKDDNLSEYQ